MCEYESSTQQTSTLSGISESTSSTMLMVFTIFSYKKKERKKEKKASAKRTQCSSSTTKKQIKSFVFVHFLFLVFLPTKKWKDGGRNMKRIKEKRRIVILTDLNNVNSSSIKAKPTVWRQRSKPFLKVNAQRSGLKVEKRNWKKYEVK